MSEAATATNGPTMPDEKAWNAALAGWFYGPHLAGRPAYLSVDEAVLQSISAAHDWPLADPIGSLRQSLLPYLKRVLPFSYWIDVSSNWAKSAKLEPPPFIHLLALTVLATTERPDGSERRVARGLPGYYPPLFEVLGIEDTKGRREDYRWKVPELWKLVGSWLDSHEGQIGLPTAREGNHATAYIEYSLSQAIVRSADRGIFIDFFDQVGYAPRDDVGSDLLLARFEVWAAKLVPSVRVRRALGDVSRREILGEILRHDLRAWTGETRDENYHEVFRVKPRLNSQKRTLTATISCPTPFAGLTVGGVKLAASGHERVHLNHKIVLEHSTRRERIELGDKRFELRHALIHAFEEDDLLGGYTAVSRMTRGRTAWLVVSQRCTKVTAFLESEGFRSEEWTNIPGWFIFRNVRLGHEQVSVAPSDLGAFLPASGLRAELQGGLALGYGRYLVDGPPDLVVPASPLELKLLVNGALRETIEKDIDRRIPLSRYLDHQGKYVLDVGDQSLRIELQTASASAERPPPLVHILLPFPPTVLDLSTTTLPGDVTISGAAIQGVSTAPVAGYPAEALWKPSTDVVTRQALQSKRSDQTMTPRIGLVRSAGRPASGELSEAAPTKDSVSDQMLRWCSIRKAGSIASFVETCQWFSNSWEEKALSYRSLKSLWYLGHVEIDWPAQRWGITPPRLVAPLPATGDAFLVGLRDDDLSSRLAQLVSLPPSPIRVTRVPQQRAGGPAALAIRATSLEALTECAEQMDAPLVVDVANKLTDLLPSLDRMVRGGDIPLGFETRRIEISGHAIHRSPTLDELREGSYEHDTFGAQIYSIRNVDGERHLVDKSTAIWHALRRLHLYPATYDEFNKAFAVPLDVGLPLFHQRALIMSTGLLPQIATLDSKHHLVYSCVSAATAQRIKETLSE